VGLPVSFSNTLALVVVVRFLLANPLPSFL
jgi:hypothetical protein